MLVHGNLQTESYDGLLVGCCSVELCVSWLADRILAQRQTHQLGICLDLEFFEHPMTERADRPAPDSHAGSDFAGFKAVDDQEHEFHLSARKIVEGRRFSPADSA